MSVPPDSIRGRAVHAMKTSKAFKAMTHPPHILYPEWQDLTERLMNGPVPKGMSDKDYVDERAQELLDLIAQAEKLHDQTHHAAAGSEAEPD